MSDEILKEAQPGEKEQLPGDGVASATQQTARPSLRQRLLTAGTLQGATVVLEQGVYSITNFLAGVLVARSTTREEFGAYVLGFGLLIIVQGLQASLFGIPFTMHSPRLGEHERPAYLGNTLLQQLSCALGAMLLAAGATPLAVKFGGASPTIVPVFLAMAAAGVVLLTHDFLRSVLLAQLRVRTSLLTGLAFNGLVTTSLLIAFGLGRLNAAAAFLLMAGAAVPVAGGVLFLLARGGNLTVRRADFLPAWARNYGFGKWLVARSLISFVAVQLYPWVLALCQNGEAVAVYGACLSLAGAVNPLFMGLGKYLAPRAAHAACEGSGPLRRAVYGIIALLAGPLALYVLAAAVVGEPVLVALYGSRYSGGGAVLAFCAVAISITALASPLSAGINALHRPEVGLKSQLLASLASILIGLPLVGAFGAVGAAVGLAITNLASATYSWQAFASLLGSAQWPDTIRES